MEGRVSVDGLAEKFEVTPQTIRKDLNDLCEQRLLSRIHGGAVIASGVENTAYEARTASASAPISLPSPTARPATTSSRQRWR